MTRTFEDQPAVRSKTPLLIGLVSPSGAGKTFSALRLATGIQRVAGGDVFVIDTEARRALHYADKFNFRHVAFGAPFGPLDYLAAIAHCVKKGAKTIVIDSMSHEHEGPGGVLEMHEAELTRMAGTDYRKRQSMTMLAWHKPKSQRRQLINAMLQMDANFILCFRSKEKLKMVKGQEPEQLGWMPIAGQEFVFEMTLKCLFLPGGNGVPVLESNYEGERAMIKVPDQFRSLFAQPRQMSEDLGEELARWAAGSAAPAAVTPAGLIASYASCSDPATWRSLEDSRKSVWTKTSKLEKEQLKTASDGARDRIAAAEAATEYTTDDAATGEAEFGGEVSP